MTTPDTDPLDAPTAALAAAVLDISRHIEGAPLTAPRLYALARSAELMAASPALAGLLGVGADGTGAPDDLHLTPIDLDDGAADQIDGSAPQDPLAALQVVQWPDLADGGAIACELSPSTWALHENDSRATIPTDRALRVVVAALPDGTTWSAVHRGDKNGYVLGAALLPDVATALVQTLQPLD